MAIIFVMIIWNAAWAVMAQWVYVNYQEIKEASDAQFTGARRKVRLTYQLFNLQNPIKEARIKMYKIDI